MFTHPERKRDTPVRKSNRIRKVEVAYTPPLTPADRKRNQRCLQGNNKRELDKSQTQVRVQKHRMAQPETVHEAEKTQTLVRVQKLCESQTEAVRKTERIEGSDRSAPWTGENTRATETQAVCRNFVMLKQRRTVKRRENLHRSVGRNFVGSNRSAA